MFNTTDSIKEYLQKLGISSDISDLYLALLTHGPLSISDLSRYAGVERTHIYRLMDEMMASTLIEIEVQYKRNIFRAAPVSHLQVLLAKKEQEVYDLRKGFDELQQSLTSDSFDTPHTKIQSYKGPEGLRQMLWNQSKGEGENVSILYENMQSKTNEKFFERWVDEFNKRGSTSRSLIGDHFIKSQKEWYRTHNNERIKKWNARYVSEDLFPITYSTVVYNDVTAYYKWTDEEAFGIELHNKEIANTQRRFFDILWQQSTPLQDLRNL